MALNPNGSGEYRWKYKEGELELTGTILTMQEVQACEFNQYNNQPGRPRYWPDGNPVLNIRIGLADMNGNFRSVTFAKAGKKQRSGEKPSLHMDMYNLSGGNMNNLIGKTVHLWTWPTNPTTGQIWGPGNPRLFGIKLVDQTYTLTPGTSIPEEFMVPVLLCNNGAHGGQPVAPNPQMMQQQMPPMQGNFYSAPQPQQYQQPMQQPYQQQQMQQQMQQMQQQYQQQQVPQPAQLQPMQQQMPQQLSQQSQAPAPSAMQQMPVTQTMPPQQVGMQMPQGMDPAVAAAMQSIGAVNVQPVQSTEADPTGGVYDDDIPFSH